MKKSLVFCGVALLTFLGTERAGAAPILSFTTATPHINVGDSVTIDATINGLGAEILSAYDLNFTYSSTVLNWQVITQFIAPFNVNFSSITGFDNVVEGDLGFFLTSLDTDADLAANQPDSFLLFRLTLQGMTDGATSFTLGPDPDFDRSFIGLRAAPIDVDVASTCISVGTGVCQRQVPEPASIALLSLGLLGSLRAAARGRRREKTSRGRSWSASRSRRCG